MALFEEKISDEKYSKNDEFLRTSKFYTLSNVPRSKKLVILDVGCGTGINSEYMVKLGHNVVGVEISGVALDKYRGRGLKGTQCNINESLPFKNGSFDMIFASEVLEHLYDTGYFLSESYRVLKPGGTLLLSTPNSAFWLYRLLGVFGKTVSELQHPGHIRFFSKKLLAQYVKQAGFDSPLVQGRHMYILVGQTIGSLIKPILLKMNFHREYRFKTSKHFWHKSNYSKRASGFWADTLILKSVKRKTPLS